MKQQVILMDVGGYTLRLQALKDAHEHVIGITPHDKPCAGFEAICTPDEWLQADPTIEYSKKCWHGTGKLGLAAIQQLGIEADHYWFIESDCVASQDRWKDIIRAHASNPTDGVFLCPMTRAQAAGNGWWKHPGTPAWTDIVHLNAIYRISRRAVDWLLDAAEETRECFGELVIGSVIKRAGGTVGRINLNLNKPHHTNQTMKWKPEAVLLDRRLINHPVKSNTYSP